MEIVVAIIDCCGVIIENSRIVIAICNLEVKFVYFRNKYDFEIHLQHVCN